MNPIEWILTHWAWDVLAVGLVVLFAQVREVDKKRIELAGALNVHLNRLVESNESNKREIDLLKAQLSRLDSKPD